MGEIVSLSLNEEIKVPTKNSVFGKQYIYLNCYMLGIRDLKLSGMLEIYKKLQIMTESNINSTL